MTAKNALPKDAVVGGRDTDGSLIYVGRAQHEGDLLPCKVLPSKQVGYVCKFSDKKNNLSSRV